MIKSLCIDDVEGFFYYGASPCECDTRVVVHLIDLDG